MLVCFWGGGGGHWRATLKLGGERGEGNSEISGELILMCRILIGFFKSLYKFLKKYDEYGRTQRLDLCIYIYGTPRACL